MTRAALVSPRVRGAVLAPSWPAVERVLWLAAVDRALRATAADSVEVQYAYRVLRALIDTHAPRLYAQTPVDAAAETRWIVAIRDSIAPWTSTTRRAAVVVWAAVGAWTDAPQGRWGALADAAADLGDALDAATVTMRSATALRETMATKWREMGR